MKYTGNACPAGWTFLQANGKGKCYQFVLNGRDHLPWYSTFQYCQSIGAKTLHVENWGEQNAIARYFSEWNRLGIGRMWLGLSDFDHDHPKPDLSCNFRYQDSYGDPAFTNWDQTTEQPKCEEKANSCAYVNTANNKWYTTNCNAMEAFGCEARVRN